MRAAAVGASRRRRRACVRLTPKGGRDAIDGIEELADGQCVLKARVRAAPSEGEANDALILLCPDARRPTARRRAHLGRTVAHQAAHYCGRSAHADRGAGEDRRARC